MRPLVAQYSRLDDQTLKRVLPIARRLAHNPALKVRLLRPETLEALGQLLTALNGRANAARTAPGTASAPAASAVSTAPAPALAPAAPASAAPAQPPVDESRRKVIADLHAEFAQALDRLVSNLKPTAREEEVRVRVKNAPELCLTLNLTPSTHTWKWGMVGKPSIVLADADTLIAVLEGDVGMDVVSAGKIRGDFMRLLGLLKVPKLNCFEDGSKGRSEGVAQ